MGSPRRLLLKQAQLALKAARPAEPRASPPQDDPQDYSKAIAFMRKEYFADVDGYERSGLLKIPPLPDPCGAGILPASPADPKPPWASPLGAPQRSVGGLGWPDDFTGWV